MAKKSNPLDTRAQIDLFPAKRGRGRPRKAQVLTNAERQARFRARQKVAGTSGAAGVLLRELSIETLAGFYLELSKLVLATRGLERRFGAQAEVQQVLDIAHGMMRRFDLK